MQKSLAESDGAGIRPEWHLVAVCLASLFLAAGADVCCGGTADTFARGAFVAGPYPTGPFTFVNDAVGAGIFYNSGFFGSSTVVGNVEAGYVWDGHSVFDRSGLGLGPAVERRVAGTGVAGAYDFHATMVGHVLAGTGYVAATGSSAAGYSYVGAGMAPLAKLWSGAIATRFSTAGPACFKPDSAAGMA
jgi:hypothetical protein